MLSCASRDQPYKFTKEDTCYYGKFTARKLERDATTTSAGHEERGYEVMGGVQVVAELESDAAVLRRLLASSGLVEPLRDGYAEGQ